jgi:Fe-S-cluster containining protein
VTSADQLCLACGLCCDGTLFDNVRLGPGDAAEKLKALGLPVRVTRAKTPTSFFRQPCAALCENRTCRVYADRPSQCRSFECGVFKSAQAGRISFTAGLRQVTRARRKADHIRQLLRELGDTEEHRSLSERFRRVQQRMETEAVDAVAAGMFAELGQEMHAFKLLAHGKFYTRMGEE